MEYSKDDPNNIGTILRESVSPVAQRPSSAKLGHARASSSNFAQPRRASFVAAAGARHRLQISAPRVKRF
jgi:hypothetical protein